MIISKGILLKGIIGGAVIFIGTGGVYFKNFRNRIMKKIFVKKVNLVFDDHESDYYPTPEVKNVGDSMGVGIKRESSTSMQVNEQPNSMSVVGKKPESAEQPIISSVNIGEIQQITPAKEHNLGIPENCKVNQVKSNKRQICELNEEQIERVKFVMNDGESTPIVMGLDDDNKIVLTIENADDEKVYPKGKKYTFKTKTNDVTIKGIKGGDITLTEDNGIEFREIKTGGKLEWVTESIKDLLKPNGNGNVLDVSGVKMGVVGGDSKISLVENTGAGFNKNNGKLEEKALGVVKLGEKVNFECEEVKEECTMKPGATVKYTDDGSTFKSFTSSAEETPKALRYQKNQDGYNQGFMFIPKEDIKENGELQLSSKSKYEIKSRSDSNSDWLLFKKT